MTPRWADDVLAAPTTAPAPGRVGRAAIAASRRDRTVAMIVSNPLFRHDGWHDIRVHRFARAFQALGLEPVVYCRGYAGAAAEAGIWEGLRYRRLLMPAPVAAGPEAPSRAALPRRIARRGRAAGLRGVGLALRPVRRARAWAASSLLHYLNPSFTRAVLAASAGERPRLVYAADLNCLLAGYHVSRRSGAPLIYDSHEYFPSRAEHEWMSGPRRVLDKAACRLLERRYFPRIGVVLGVSESIVSAFRRRVPSGNYLCVRNVPPRRRCVHRRDLIRAKLGLPESTRIVLYIGFVTGGRGVRELIDAVRLLPEDIAVALLGGGRHLERERAYAQSAGLHRRVFFLGHVRQEDVLDYAESADCGVCLIQPTCLSYYYSLPNKIFQYVSAGLPVVCSDFPDMRAVVQGHGLGRTVDPTDPAAVAAAIRGVLDDHDGLAAMRANCLRAAAEELNWETESRKLLTLGAVREALA